MAVMIVRQEVKNFAEWKSFYDQYNDTRKDAGVKMAAIHRDPDNENIIILMQQFNNLDAAFSFAESEETQFLLAKAGVVGQPEIWFGEDVEFTIY